MASSQIDKIKEDGDDLVVEGGKKYAKTTRTAYKSKVEAYHKSSRCETLTSILPKPPPILR